MPPDCLLYRAVNGTRTRDPRLGKPMLYQLSHYRLFHTAKLENTWIFSAIRPILTTLNYLLRLPQRQGVLSRQGRPLTPRLHETGTGMYHFVGTSLSLLYMLYILSIYAYVCTIIYTPIPIYAYNCIYAYSFICLHCLYAMPAMLCDTILNVSIMLYSALYVSLVCTPCRTVCL